MWVSRRTDYATRAVLALSLADGGPLKLEQLAATTRWITGQDPDGAKITSLKLPVIVAGAVKDWTLPADNTRHLAAVIPGAKRLMYADAAHGFFIQVADEFVPRVAKFLRP